MKWLLWLLLAAVLAGCATRSEPPLVVAAAASLADAFRVVAEDFEREEGVPVALSFAGSPAVVAQVARGAPVDVVATADEQTMEQLAVDGHVGRSLAFASNHLVLVTPPGNPAGIHAVADLGRVGVRLVLAGPEVPAGRQARALLATLGVDAEHNLVSNEDDVRAVLSKVVLGEADAGIVYRSDAAAAGTRVRVVPLAEVGPAARYQIAVAVSSGRPALAERFVAFVVGPEGQWALQQAGFTPVYPPAERGGGR